MNLITLTAIGILAMPLLGLAQGKGYKSVCLGGEPAGDDVVLNVCNHEHGMVAFPQPRLYLRVFADGRGEIETNPPAPPGDAYEEERLIKKTFHVDADEIAEIRRLGSMADFQNMKAVYPAYAIGTDSSVDTTLTFNDQGKAKKVVVTNFSYASVENHKHYGLSFCLMMARVDVLRDPGLGIVREPPTISFCELMRNREYYVGSVIAMNAVLEYGEKQQSIFDPECAEPAIGRALFTTERVGVGFDPKRGKSKELEKQALKLRGQNFGGRARVYIYGILRDDRERAADSYDYRFDITEFKTIDRIIVDYKGILEPGWTYVDSFDAKGDELKLSSPLKTPIHHTVRIEWLNADKYPRLRAAGHTFITFRVISKDIKNMGNGRWNDTYTCEFVEVQ